MSNQIIPSTDELFDPWFNNFVMKFAGYATLLGFTAGDATALSNEYDYIHWAFTAQGMFETELNERIHLKRLLRDGPVGEPTPGVPTVPTLAVPAGAMPAPGIVPRLRKMIQAIKNHKNYTEAIGQDLGIIATASAPDLNPKPIATGTAAMNSEVTIAFKKGTHDAVVVEGQRGAETGWTQLDKVMRSPWVDARPPLVAGQPEVRKYRLCYCDGNDAVGDFSDIITVVTRP